MAPTIVRAQSDDDTQERRGSRGGRGDRNGRPGQATTATADPGQATTERIGVRVVMAPLVPSGSSGCSISRRSPSRARNCARR